MNNKLTKLDYNIKILQICIYSNLILIILTKLIDISQLISFTVIMITLSQVVGVSISLLLSKDIDYEEYRNFFENIDSEYDIA